MPPAFVPRSFTPPVTFAAPSPGDGFGASVASVAGNVAIGAPFDNGPSSPHHPGAVFLYDGVPTDDGISTNYAYGALIHVFADPNPAAGDEFGASIATVGNDLLVGAPGSSLTGPGDGAAYLFDANPEQPDIRRPAGDIHPPRPRRGAPGAFRRRGGRGQHERSDRRHRQGLRLGRGLRLRGRPHAAHVRQPAARHRQPACRRPAREFGAAVAGIGGDVIVGAPFDDDRGHRRPASSTCSTARPARRLTAIANPRPASSTGFGSAVASVGANILIGSPLDNTAGPAPARRSCYSPSGVLLQTFVQPDGGGGHFGASVAGTRHHGPDRRAGATLGTSDAGAAYLFDANPSSSTFGRPIAAEQEPTPVTGDAFGGAVGFLDINGALLIGAAGAGGSGAEAADLYQPGAPLSVSATTTYATAAPYDSVIVSGTFVVPGNFDTLTRLDRLGRRLAPRPS